MGVDVTFIAIKATNRIAASTRMNERQVGIVVRARLQDEVEDLGSEGQSQWPKDTGLSASGLEWGVDASSGSSASGITAFVQDLVWYSGYVRIPGGNAWLRLVVEPAELDEDELIDDLADSVVDAMLGGM